MPEHSPGTGRKNSAGERTFRPAPGLSNGSCQSQGSRLGLLSFALRACQVTDSSPRQRVRGDPRGPGIGPGGCPHKRQLESIRSVSSFLKPGGRKTVAHGASRASEVPEQSPGTGRKNPVGEKTFRPVPGLSNRSPESQGSRLGLLSFALRACQVSVTLAPMGGCPAAPAAPSFLEN